LIHLLSIERLTRLSFSFLSPRFVDGDLAANNGGWQWIASTGTDPQPYFRIFNPLSQSEKADPSGDYIRSACFPSSSLFLPTLAETEIPLSIPTLDIFPRYFVPELKGLKGKGSF